MIRAPGRLVLVGSVIADVMMTVPALPDRGGDMLASSAVTQPGGGFNVLVAATRLGLPAALAGQVGGGAFGRVVAAGLEAEGVAALLPPREADHGFCVGFIEPDAERTFVTSPGVEAQLTLADLAGVPIRLDDAVYVSGYDLCYPATGPAVAAWCRTLPDTALLVVDPGPLAAEIPGAVADAVLARCDLLTLNAREVRLLAGDAGVSALRPRLRPAAAAGVLLVRDGARGCTLHLPDQPEPVSVPAPVVTAVDTTGAGDAHTGALLAELARGSSLVAAAQVANTAAAFAVTKVGSATAPTREELEAFSAR